MNIRQPLVQFPRENPQNYEQRMNQTGFTCQQQIKLELSGIHLLNQICGLRILEVMLSQNQNTTGAYINFQFSLS